MYVFNCKLPVWTVRWDCLLLWARRWLAFFWQIGGCSTFSGSNYILVIASCRRTSKGSLPPCPLFHRRGFGAASEWMTRYCEGQPQKKEPAKSKIRLFLLFEPWCQARVFSRGQRGRTRVKGRIHAREKPLVILTCCRSFPSVVCGREALKLPGKTAHSERFEEACWGSGLRKLLSAARWFQHCSYSQWLWLTFSRASSDCKTGITCFKEPLLAGSQNPIYMWQKTHQCCWSDSKAITLAYRS